MIQQQGKGDIKVHEELVYKKKKWQVIATIAHSSQKVVILA